jgi:hypothetical protein
VVSQGALDTLPLSKGKVRQMLLFAVRRSFAPLLVARRRFAAFAVTFIAVALVSRFRSHVCGEAALLALVAVAFRHTLGGPYRVH